MDDLKLNSLMKLTLLLFLFLFYMTSFGQDAKKIDDQASKYSFTGELVEETPLAPYCGTFAWATVFKFKIIKTDLITNNEYLLVIITCPRMRPKNYFKEGAIYEGTIATNSRATFSWMIQNQYEKENLPTFWAREFDKRKKKKSKNR
jgi:hypothetical protein